MQDIHSHEIYSLRSYRRSPWEYHELFEKYFILLFFYIWGLSLNCTRVSHFVMYLCMLTRGRRYALLRVPLGVPKNTTHYMCVFLFPKGYRLSPIIAIAIHSNVLVCVFECKTFTPTRYIHGDVLYSLLSLGCEVGIDSNNALDEIISKYSSRLNSKQDIGSGD